LNKDSPSLTFSNCITDTPPRLSTSSSTNVLFYNPIQPNALSFRANASKVVVTSEPRAVWFPFTQDQRRALPDYNHLLMFTGRKVAKGYPQYLFWEPQEEATYANSFKPWARKSLSIASEPDRESYQIKE